MCIYFSVSQEYPEIGKIIKWGFDNFTRFGVYYWISRFAKDSENLSGIQKSQTSHSQSKCNHDTSTSIIFWGNEITYARYQLTVSNILSMVSEVCTRSKSQSPLTMFLHIRCHLRSLQQRSVERAFVQTRIFESREKI